MKYNIYYQSLTLCRMKAGVSDYMTIYKDDYLDVLELAHYQGRILSHKLKERVACVICDESDIVLDYFQANSDEITCPALSNNMFRGNKAMTDDDGKFFVDCH